MSLLADLLSKIKPLSGKGDVPPGLRQTVSDYSRKETIKKKIVILSLLFVLAVAGGVVTVYVMDYAKTSALKTAGRRTTAGNKAAPAAPPSSQPMGKPETGSEIPAAPAQKPETAAPAPAPEHKPAARVPGKLFAKRHVTGKKAASKIQDSGKDTAKRQEAPQKPVDNTQEDIYLYTARTHESRKEYAEALLNYRKALEIEPKNYIIMNNISSMLLFLNSYAEAMSYSRSALNMRNDYVPSLINLGIANIQTSNLAEGESYLLKALSLEPANRYVLLNLAILYEKKGDNNRAYDYFRKLSEKDDLQGYLGAARIAEKQGRIPDAVRIYKDVFSMDNAGPEIKRLANDNLIRLQPQER